MGGDLRAPRMGTRSSVPPAGAAAVLSCFCKVCELLLRCGERLLLSAQLRLERVVVGLLHLIAARQRQCEGASASNGRPRRTRDVAEMHKTSCQVNLGLVDDSDCQPEGRQAITQ